MTPYEIENLGDCLMVQEHNKNSRLPIENPRITSCLFSTFSSVTYR